MNCPKCNSVCRSKMAGAVCLNTKCNWYTHNINNLKIINNEINNSGIGSKFKELEVQQIISDYEDMYNPYDGL